MQGTTLALGLHDMPDGSKKVKLMILTTDEAIQFFFFLSPEQAEATGKAMQTVAIQARTSLTIPPGAIIDA
jgi:hypothetical protein